MIERLRRLLRQRGAFLFALATLLLVLQPRTAFAFDVIANGGLYEDGKGGYGIDGSTDHGLWVGDGTGIPVVKALPDCDDSGGNHLNYDTGTRNFSCGTSSSSSATPNPMGFTTVSQIDLNNDAVFVGSTGNVSATEANVARMPVPITGTLDNLRCSASANPGGTSLTVEMAVGTCGSAITFDCSTGDQCVTLPGGATATSADTDDVAVSAGQCIAFKVTATGNTTAVFLGCSWTLT